MASTGKAPYEPDRPDQSLRREALEQAVRFASGPNSSGSTAGIVNAAKDFYEFLKGDA